MNYSLGHLGKPLYHAMKDPNEFTIIGNTRYWDVSGWLGGIRVRTLVTGDRDGGMTLWVAKDIQKRIMGSNPGTFEKSAHLPFRARRQRYTHTLSESLAA